MGRKVGNIGGWSAAAPTAGFSLIELVTVVAIMAVLAVGVSMTAVAGRGGAESDLKVFKRSFSQSRALAVQGRHIRALQISPSGMRIAQWHNGEWRLSDHQSQWHGGATFVEDPVGRQYGGPITGPITGLTTGLIAGRGGPKVIFLPNGQTTAVRSVFAGLAACHSDGWSGLICDAG
jgi:prepilin-type N-terminal cleavage/methylation domain-containing protein